MNNHNSSAIFRLISPLRKESSGTEEEGSLSALMTAGPPDMDKVDMKFEGFDRQKEDPYSVFAYYRNAVLLRNAFPVIAWGKTSVVDEMTGDSICAFTRTDRKSRQLG